MGHQEASGVTHRWRLVDLFMAPGHFLPTGTDQVDAECLDEVLTDFS